MSIVRMNTRCEHTSLSGRRCAVDPCPGSSVYVFEDLDGDFVCSGCSHTTFDIGTGTRGEFRTKHRYVMEAHLRVHAQSGDHVSPTVIVFFHDEA